MTIKRGFVSTIDGVSTDQRFYSRRVRKTASPTSEPKPTFRFIHKGGRDGDPKLYELEGELRIAVDAILDHRVGRYDEDKWKQALPETLFFLLDSYEGRLVAPAIAHWLLRVKQVDRRVVDALFEGR